MNECEIYAQIKKALQEAPRNQYTAELHLQMIKYADELKNITAKEFPDYHRDSASFSNRCGMGAVRIPALAKSVTIHSRLNR